MVRLLLSLLLLTVLTGCSQLAEQRQLNTRKKQVQSDLAAYRQAVQAAVAARITIQRITPQGRGDAKRVFNLSTAEFQQLKQILSHTRPMPLSPREPISVPVRWACYFHLELLSADGRVLATKDPSVTWTSETRMLNTPVDYASTIYDPTWYLPDADFLAMARLPSMRAADKWVRTGR